MHNRLIFAEIWNAKRCPLFVNSIIDKPLDIRTHDFNDFLARTHARDEELWYRHAEELEIKDFVGQFIEANFTIEAQTIFEACGETMREIGWQFTMPSQKLSATLESFIGGRPWQDIVKKAQIIKNPIFDIHNIIVNPDYILIYDKLIYPVFVRASNKIRDIFIGMAELTMAALKQLNLPLGLPLLLHISEHAHYQPNRDSKMISLVSLGQAVKHQKAFSEEIKQIFHDASLLKGCGKSNCPYCKASEPPFSVSNFYKGGRIVNLLKEKGVFSIKDMILNQEYEALMTREHKIQYKAIKESNNHIDKKQIENFLSTIQYPALAIDFECELNALPKFEGLKCFEHSPFLLSSLQILGVGENVENPVPKSFIAEINQDSRYEMMKFLLEEASHAKTVIVYGALLEKQILLQAAQIYPDLKQKLLELREKLVDLHDVFANFYYYNPIQDGKTSLKKMVEILGTNSYRDMKVRDGGKVHILWGLLSLNSQMKERICQELKIENDAFPSYESIIKDIQIYAEMDVISIARILSALNRLL